MANPKYSNDEKKRALLKLEECGYKYAPAARALKAEGFTVSDKTLLSWHQKYAYLLSDSSYMTTAKEDIDDQRTEIRRQSKDIVASATEGVRSVVKKLNDLVETDSKKLKVADIISIGEFLSGLAGFSQAGEGDAEKKGYNLYFQQMNQQNNTNNGS